MPSLNRQLGRVAGLVAGYILAFWLTRLVYLTFVTYTFVRTPEASALQKIGDVVHANEVLTYGFSALLFVLALQILQPLTRTQFRQVFNFERLKSCFGPNALAGLILSTVLILGSTLGGHMSYLGVYMKFDEVMLSLGSGLMFAAAFFTMIVVEEYIFREALQPRLDEALGAIGAAAVSSAVYVLVKYLQFDLGWIEAINLVLLNLALSMIARSERGYMASASFCGTFLALVHVLFGLPFMGQDMPGIFLLRASGDESLGRLLSGGAQGPEAGMVLGVLLLIYLYLPQIRSKKIEV